MPFHSWIPDAAIDAPLPFMAILPASIEKLLGIYFLARISLDLFTLRPGSWVSTTLMVVGRVTIILAVLMALVQKNYKRLLSYHAISQVGYMILGIGTALPIGIIGGLFHMINHAMYKSCLFLTGGAVEKQAGTTDLEKLGGLARGMPVTVICFIVAAASISGVPPFNGFFSKEMVYHAALESGWVFYAVALLGSFFTAASFLKLGHAAFFGKRAIDAPAVKEAPLPMLIPMIVLAGLCILFGVGNSIPLGGLIQPAVGTAVTGWPELRGVPREHAPDRADGGRAAPGGFEPLVRGTEDGPGHRRRGPYPQRHLPRAGLRGGGKGAARSVLHRPRGGEGGLDRALRRRPGVRLVLRDAVVKTAAGPLLACAARA